MNRSCASKYYSSSLWVNFKVSRRIALVLCTRNYLFKNLITICSYDVKLLADNVLNQERALSFRENRNSPSLRSLYEKLSYLKVWQTIWKSFKSLYGS